MINFEKNEHIVFEVRKHWLVIVSEIGLLIIFSLIPILVLSYLPKDLIRVTLAEGSLSSLIVFIYSVWLMILWLVGFVMWTDYYLDVWIVTNKRIMDVEQKGLFKREISTLHLDKIQDITFKIRGLIPTLLNYGDIYVRTASSTGDFTIPGVPNPPFVQAKINEALILRKKYLVEHPDEL